MIDPLTQPGKKKDHSHPGRSLPAFFYAKIQTIQCVAILLILFAFPLYSGDLKIEGTCLFYGDNTEFSGPYREGETILGAYITSWLTFRPAPGISVRAGLIGNGRYGSDEFMEETDPILSFVYRKHRHELVIGSYFPESRHGFLDALQVSTLELTRPVERGFLWSFEGSRLRNRIFLNWQQINNSEQREIFDSGLITEWKANNFCEFSLQWHSWHQGGQLTSVGRVVNNNAGAVGISLTPDVSGTPFLRGCYLVSRTTKDPDYPKRPEDGSGTLFMAGFQLVTPVTIHALWFEGEDFHAFEGDPNYSSVGLDPTDYTPDREYGELGATARFSPGGETSASGELRFHWIDDRDPTVSFRFTVMAPFRFPLIDERTGHTGGNLP